MKLIKLILMLCLFSNLANAKDSSMKLKISFEDKTVIVALANNSVTEQLVTMLPKNFEFTDFAGEEKITEFPKSVDLTKAPRRMIARAGKMFSYVPWGNLGIFYKNHSFFPDNNLLEIGEVESGLEYLANHKGGFKARLEIITGE